MSKDQTKCAKLVEEKNNRMFCCPSFRGYEPKILYIFTIKKKRFVRKLIFFLGENLYILLI